MDEFLYYMREDLLYLSYGLRLLVDMEDHSTKVMEH